MFSLFPSLTTASAEEEESQEIAVTEQAEANVAAHHYDATAATATKTTTTNDETTTTATTTTSTTRHTKTTTTWKDAHDEYCGKQNVLRASIQQVLEDYYDSCRTSEDNQEIPWELPTRPTVVINEQELFSRSSLLSPPPPTTATTTPSSSSKSVAAVFQWTKQLASGWISTILSPDGDADYYETPDWQQSDDDALEDASSSSQQLDWNLPIIHVPHTLNCLQHLQQRIRTETTAGASSSPMIIMAKSNWNTWCSTTENDSSFLAKLSLPDTEWLLTLLVSCQQAKILKRQDRVDLVILGGSSSCCCSSSNSKNDVSDEEHNNIDNDVHITLWDLSQAQERLETQLQDWTSQATECSQKALQYKQQQQMPMALSQMAKRKLLHQRIDTSTKTLMKLEQTRAAIEMVHSNKEIFELLRQSSTILKELNASATPVEQIEEVHQDLQSEFHQIQEAMMAAGSTSSSTVNNNNIDDEELLEELENLTLEQEEEHVLVPAFQNSTSTSTSTSTVKKKEDASPKRVHAKPTTTASQSVSTERNADDPKLERKPVAMIGY